MSRDQKMEANRLSRDWYDKLKDADGYDHATSHVLVGFVAREEYGKDFLFKWLPSALLTGKGLAYGAESVHYFSNAFQSATPMEAALNVTIGTALAGSGTLFTKSSAEEFWHQNGSKVKFLYKNFVKAPITASIQGAEYHFENPRYRMNPDLPTIEEEVQNAMTPGHYLSPAMYVKLHKRQTLDSDFKNISPVVRSTLQAAEGHYARTNFEMGTHYAAGLSFNTHAPGDNTQERLAGAHITAYGDHDYELEIDGQRIRFDGLDPDDDENPATEPA